jgi:hypothetical protein
VFLFDLLTSQKIALSLIRIEKKFFEIGAKGIQKEAEFFSLLLNSRLLHIYEIRGKFRFFWHLLKTILMKFLALIRTVLLFSEVRMSNKIETIQYLKKHFFINQTKNI